MRVICSGFIPPHSFMEPRTYLRERIYYEELYDRHTVEKCHIYDEGVAPQYKLDFNGAVQDQRDKPVPVKMAASNILLYFLTGSRYVEKDEVISKWIERDQDRDRMMETTKVPRALCPKCSCFMECAYKTIEIRIDDKPERINFFLVCKDCRESKHVYEDGTEIIRKPILCPKCKHALDTSIERKGKKRLYKEACSGCGYKSVEEDIVTAKEPTEEEVRKFATDKARFCLTPEKGEVYRRWMSDVEKLREMMAEREENKDIYEKMPQIKKLSLMALEKHLSTVLKKHGFARLKLAEPQAGREFSVSFTVYEGQEGRDKYQSEKVLKQLFKKALADTNWTLMTEGINSRLGVLSGRFRGYESEEELKALVAMRMKKQLKTAKSFI
jgi:hypothetical protein